MFRALMSAFRKDREMVRTWATRLPDDTDLRYALQRILRCHGRDIRLGATADEWETAISTLADDRYEEGRWDAALERRDIIPIESPIPA
jgi:hypothetical protein